jgi:ubiquitin-like modifier-activating enzyme ATG7
VMLRQTQSLGLYLCGSQVTRPGVAPIASAHAVELMVNLLHHPRGACAASSESTPHQLRGFLHDFSVVKLQTASFTHCTACSRGVVDAFTSDPEALLRQALEEPEALERISGLADLKAAVDADASAIECVADGDDW